MADQEQLALLRQGFEAWNLWRAENPDVEIDLSYADLSATNLDNINLSSANLSFTNFSFANLFYADLSNANLSDASLSNAQLFEANLFKADLSFASLSEANLIGANLSKAKLSSADLSDANLSDADLSSTNLCKAKLNSASLSADLSGADLSGADLSSAYLGRANLHRANLYKANLSSADFSDANLSSADFSNTNLCGANFFEANLSDTNLSDADLSFASLSNADLSNTDLSGANLSFASLSNANLSNANLSTADIRNTDLRNADLSGTNLSDANLYASQVLHANFSGATLTGACIAHCPIGDSTILDGTKCDYIFRAVRLNGQFIERRPHNPDRIFEPGEFAKLVEIHENTVELIFRKGISWSAFAHAFNETNTKVIDASGQELYLKKYEVLDNGLIRLEVTVPPGSDKQVVHNNLERGYEQQIARLEGVVQAQDKMLEQVLRMLKPGDIYMNSSKYDQRGAQFAGGFAETVNGNQIGGIINNYGQNTDDILRLLTSLRDLSQSFPDDQKEKAQMALDGLEADLNKPEKPSPKRLGQWLKMLILAGTAAATFVEGAATFSGNVNEFTDNTSKLIETLGLSREDIQPTP